MKTHKQSIIDHVQIYLDVNVGDYSYFDSNYWFKKYTKHYKNMDFDELELIWIANYLLEIEESNKN